MECRGMLECQVELLACPEADRRVCREPLA